MKPLNINIQFLASAVPALPPTREGLHFPSHAIQQQPLQVGDKLRIAGIPNCPWFVIEERYWDLGADEATLTIWLGLPED